METMGLFEPLGGECEKGIGFAGEWAGMGGT